MTSPSNTYQLNIGIVGLGTHAQRGHIDHLEKIEAANIVAVCDPDQQARDRQVAAGFTGGVYAGFDELLADEKVQAVFVCSPDRFHAESLSKAVAAGKHVFVEKPVAEKRGDLVVVTDALRSAANNHIVVTSCHPRRFDPPFMWLKDNLSVLADELGAVLDVRFDFFYHEPTKEGLHHGLLIDHINHELDLIHFIFGFSPFTAHKLFDSEIRYGAAGSREDGICFTFFGSRHLKRTFYSEIMRVRFETGEVTIDAETGIATIRNWDEVGAREEICGATDYELRFGAVNEDFIDSVLQGTSPYLTSADLIVNTEIGIALTEDGKYDSASSASHSLR